MTTTSAVLPLRDGDHVVQFYGDDHELETTAFARLAAAVGAGGVAVVIATPEHLAGCRRIFSAAGLDADRAVAQGRLQLLVAAEVLQTFVVEGRLDPAAFDRTVGHVVRGAGATGRRVHAFGEMVGLLWAEGNVSGAIELEQLWDALGERLDFSLHCGYPAGLMAPPTMAAGFEAVCGLHSDVLGRAPAPAGPLVVRHFVRHPRALEAARRFVADTLAAWGLSELLDDASVVVSELATNAILHGSSPFTVSLSRERSSVRLVVGDKSAAHPQPREPDLARHGGRGLHLVDAIASRWGSERVEGGKLVWAELAPAT